MVKTNKKNSLVKVFDNPLPITNKKKDKHHKEGPISVKVMNVMFSIYKWIYVCIIFYFVPMTFLVLNQFNLLKLYLGAAKADAQISPVWDFKSYI